MTYATEQIKAGREPLTVVEMDLDTCSLTYGVGGFEDDFSVALGSRWTEYTAGVATTWSLSSGALEAVNTSNGERLFVVTGSSSTNGTIDCDVQISSSGNCQPTIVARASDSGTDSCIQLRAVFNAGGASDNDGLYLYSPATGGGTVTDFADYVFTEGDWYHVCLVFSGENVTGNIYTSTDLVNPLASVSISSALITTGTYGVSCIGNSATMHWENYDVAGCAATGGAGAECYNTRATCQDTANYSRGTKTLKFSEPSEGLPAGVEMFPCITRVQRAPTRITNDFGLGHRASVTITFQDFTHHDRGCDPYVDNRTKDLAGTFWGRLRARSPYYQGRTLRIRTGYLGDSWDWTNFQDFEYVIEEIRGPTAAGVVQVIAKDVLKLADDDRAVCPAASDGELQSGITIGATTMNIVGTIDYDSAGFVRIGDEIIEYTGKTGTGTSGDPWVLTGLVRTDITWNTTASAHDADDSVQLCKAFEGVNVRDIIDTLLVTYAGVSSGYIDATQWDDEETEWLTTYSLTTILSEPTGVATLISELQEQCMVRIWWDEVNQTIPLKSLTAPLTAPPVLNDTDNVLVDSLVVKDVPKERVSQVWIVYNLDDYTSDDIGNYKRAYITADANAEGADQYGDSRIHRIESRWFNETHAAAAAQTASRMLTARRDNPRRVSWSMDAKDSSHWTGDVIDLEADDIQDADGSPKTTRLLIIDAKEGVGGHSYDYTGVTGIGINRYAKVAVNGLSDYAAESEANRDAYAFIADGSPPDMSNGDDAYRIQ